jgi:hypothetical protein
MTRNEKQREPTRVSLAESLKGNLLASAKASGRSLDDEIAERLQQSFESKSNPAKSEERIDALEQGLADAMQLIRDLQGEIAGSGSAGQSRTNADLRFAVAAAEAKLGSLTHQSGKRYSTHDGKVVRFVLSSPFRGYFDKGFVKIIPGHFEDDYIFLAIRDYSRGWLVPMGLIRTTLEKIPTANRTNGEKSWDPTYGNRKGREALWMGKSGELLIADHGVEIPSKPDPE